MTMTPDTPAPRANCASRLATISSGLAADQPPRDRPESWPTCRHSMIEYVTSRTELGQVVFVVVIAAFITAIIISESCIIVIAYKTVRTVSAFTLLIGC